MNTIRDERSVANQDQHSSRGLGFNGAPSATAPRRKRRRSRSAQHRQRHLARKIALTFLGLLGLGAIAYVLVISLPDSTLADFFPNGSAQLY